jgi:TonB family protein
MRRHAPLALALALVAGAGLVRPPTCGAVVCVPNLLVSSIYDATAVRVVRLGPLSERQEGSQDDGPGRFMGCTRLESFEVGGEPAGWLLEMFGKRKRFACDAVASAGDFGGGARGVLGIEFDTPSGRARAILRLPEGSAEVGFAGGVRFPVTLTESALQNWRAFMEGFARERHSSAAEFLATMFAEQPAPPPSPADSSPAGTYIVADSSQHAGGAAVPAGDCAPPPFGVRTAVASLPIPTTRVAPAYPDIARESGVDGTVLLYALVGCDGRVPDTRVKKSIPMLDAAAKAAVIQWKFTPATRLGQPVACWIEVPVKFSLH